MINLNVFDTSEYDFLRTDPRLGKNIVLFGLGGSHAYGTAVPGSDIDGRGMAVDTPTDILLGKTFGNIEYKETDTKIYSLPTMLKMLLDCNPNTCEILGLDLDQYYIISPIGQLILDNKDAFVSKKAIMSFVGFAKDQEHRLRNATIDKQEQALQEKHIMDTIECAMYTFREKYPNTANKLDLYIKDAITQELDKEIFINTVLDGVTLREYVAMASELGIILRDYNKLGKRNKNAINRDKLGKHMAHTLRLYFMGIDLLEKGQIITNRSRNTEEIALYMDCRHNKYLTDAGIPTQEFEDIYAEMQSKYEYAKQHCVLPDFPNYEKVNEITCLAHKMAIEGKI